MDYSTEGTGFWSGLDWDMTSNQGLTPLVNYNFNLQVEGMYNLPCKSVRVFQRENEYETLQEGGLNDYVHLLRKPISKPMTFQVERYVGVDMLDPLALGTDLALPVYLLVSRYQGDGENGVLDLTDSMQRIYVFTGCTVMAKEYGELNAERSGLLVETTTIAYREMVCIDNPSTLSKRSTWSMKKDHEKMNRDKERKDAKYQMGINERTKDEMEQRAQMYVDKNVKEIPMHVLEYKGKLVSTKRNPYTHEMETGIAKKNPMASKSEREKAAQRYFIPGSLSRSDYQGSTKQSAKTNKDEVRKKDMEKQATRYFLPESKSAVKYKGQQGNKAKVNVAEVRKADMEKAAYMGGAVRKKMTPQSFMESTARRYFLPGSASVAQYMGNAQKSAKVNTAEVRKAKAKEAAKRYFLPGGKKASTGFKGQTGTQAMVDPTEPRLADVKKLAIRYFLDDSESTQRQEYEGKEVRRARVDAGEVRKADAKKAAERYFLDGGKTAAEGFEGTKTKKARVNTAEVRKADAKKAAKRYFLDDGKKAAEGFEGTQTKKARVNTAEVRKADAKKAAKRYFLDGGKTAAEGFEGTKTKKAKVNATEVRKAGMQAMAKKWPPTRSAAQVTAFLKKK